MNWYLHSIYCYLLYNICHFKWLSHIDVHIYIAIRQHIPAMHKMAHTHTTHPYIVNARHLPFVCMCVWCFLHLCCYFIVSFSKQHNRQREKKEEFCTYFSSSFLLLLYLLTNLIIMIRKWKGRGRTERSICRRTTYYYYLLHGAPFVEAFYNIL